jgi:uncharacterized protein (DUF488 family)
MLLWTVGHSNHPLDTFLGLLTGHRIELLVDVRSSRGSRRYPHFGAAALAAALQRVGIGYDCISALGGRRRSAAQSHNTAWRNASFRAYADYMETVDFEEGIDRLLEMGGQHRTAYMCAEALWWRCHRALVSDHLKAHGHEVWHILSDSRMQPHPYTSAARIVAGRLSYEAAPTDPPASQP